MPSFFGRLKVSCVILSKCDETVKLSQKRGRPSDTKDRARNKQRQDEIADRKDKKLKKTKFESSKKARHLNSSPCKIV